MSKKAKADLDDGYVRIANTIMQELYKLPISNREFRVLLFIIYQTYGYNHKERELSNSYIGQGVGITRCHANEAIKKLLKAKIIKQELSGRRGAQILRLNTRLSEWVTVSETRNRTVPDTSVTEIGNTTVPEMRNRTVPDIGKQYNTDKYHTEQNNTECVGAAQAPPPHTSVFERCADEWKYSVCGVNKVSRAVRDSFSQNGYMRLTDARLRYEDDFENRTTKNNQPMGFRSWAEGGYKQYLPPVNENGVWYNIRGQKCKGEVVFE